MIVYIIDDNKGTSFTTALWFQKMNHEAIYISNAQEAFDLIKQKKYKPFDYILLDLYLNGISGLDIYEELKNQKLEDKAVFISGCDVHSEIFLKALKCDSPIVLKKFDSKELIKHLEKGTIGEWSEELLHLRSVKRQLVR